MATVEDVVVAAFARCTDLGIPTGGTRSVLYRRASIRQQQLFSEAAKRNPEYFGEVAVGVLVAGAIDIDSLPTSGLPECESAYRVEIGNHGTSTAYADGDRVNVVTVNDAAKSSLAPRVTIQKRVIRQYATDLANVTSLKLYYSRRPALMDGAADAVELPSPFEELLVLDMTIWLVKKSADVSDDRKRLMLPALLSEQQELMGAFMEHLTSFVAASETRFGGAR